MPTLKPLDKGECLQDLKVHYDKDFSNKNIASLCKTAPKLLQAAKEADIKGNQEDSFIFYMRYLNIAGYVQKSEEYKKNSDLKLSGASLYHAIETAEKISKSLEKRYQELKKKRKQKAESETVVSKIEAETKEDKGLVEEKLPTPAVPESGSISCIELFKLLQKDPSSVLIMDVRPRNQFTESHISFDCCISIPEEILTPGCSAAKLAEKLPEASKSKWHKRLVVENLVLLDWFSSSSKVEAASSLQYLRTIILKWDPSVEYRSKPLILDGGFEDWLNHYPMHCTNSKPQLPFQAFDDLLNIDDVTYPDLMDEEPKFSRATKPTFKLNFPVSNGTSEEEVVSKRQIEDISANGFTPFHQDPQISSTRNKMVSVPKDLCIPSINSSTPNIDRSSKSAAVLKYKELEAKRAIGMQHSLDLNRDRVVAESELQRLKQQQGRNELTDKARETLFQNERNLQLRIQELQDSQRAKDAENELLRKTLEEYKKRDLDMVHEPSKPTGILVTHSAEIKSLSEGGNQNLVKHRLGPGTPTGVTHNDLPTPSSASGLKRSRSSPNIAQLVQDPEQKPSLPQIDRNTKPTIQKPQNLELINRQRNFHEVYGNVRPGLTGLKNLGNSCYMNSILQCISNINVLNDYFCSGKYKENLNRSRHNPTRGEVAEEVAQVIRHLWLGQYRSIACRDLKAVVGRHMDQFRGCGQQDAHEFLTFLMDWLHNDLKLQKEELIKEVSNSSCKKSSEVDAITGATNAWNDFKSKYESFMLMGFFIQQVSTVKCSSCHAKSMNFEEPTSNLTLLLPSAARCMLTDCLRLYTSIERISGYKCESCHALHDAEKSVDLCRLPPILIIHLKRFYSDGFYQKRQTFVDFPLENLDMKNYTPNINQSHTVYNLCGVSNHYGTLEGGHYTAYCKNGTKWYKYDDQDVSEISRDEVKSTNAYILFYAAVR